MNKAPRGFTLIEMIVVVAIVGILAAAAQPMLALAARRQQEFELRQGLRTLRNAIDAYRQAVADGQVASPSNDSGCPPTLQLLVDGAPDAQSPKERKRYFLRRMPRDPFADRALPASQTWGLRSYDSPPDAPQSGSDVFDVYSRSDGIGLDGTPYREW
jgi:general secretion pathway protein G